MFDPSSYCNQYNDDLDKRIDSLRATKEAIQSPLDSLKTGLDDLAGEVPTDTNVLFGALDDLKIQTDSSLPEIPDTSDIEDMMERCGLLKESFLNKSKASISDDLFSASNDLMTNVIDDAVTNIFSGIPAFILSKAINEINKQLSGFKIVNIFSGLDDLLDCLDSLCGEDISSKILEINSIKSEMGIDNEGKLDTATLFGDAGLSLDHQTNLGSCLGSLQDVDTSVLTSSNQSSEKISSSMNLFKGIIPPDITKISNYL